MTTNEVLTRQNFITKVLLKDGDSELSKDLKVKIMAMRIEYSKVRKHFDEDLQEFSKQVITPEFEELRAIPEEDRTEEQKTRILDLVNQINSEYNAYAIKRGQDEIEIKNASLTDDEFNQLVEVNAGNDVTINGQELNSADFLEVLYSLFVQD